MNTCQIQVSIKILVFKFKFLIGVEVCAFSEKSLLKTESSSNGFEVENNSRSTKVHVATFGIPQV